MFSKLLIANRGEIACRIIRTARRMGIRTVAVHSDADAHALFVRMADEAYRLGPPPAAESYLRADRIIEIARACGAGAIHPGYGFLSENADFSRACAEAGIAFVGPKPETVEAMGSKARAKQLMGEAGVPMLPGYQGEDQSPATFEAEAERIGYPVLLKAAAGGGGKGMRIVERPRDFAGELESARREALSAFGDDRFIVEKFLAAPRHVEVQVFGDTHGNVVHLFERDCSVQRRYQKVIEEAPAPDLPAEVRAELHRAAVEAARAVDYVGAGTVEFLYDGADGVYFMEMNTRLQVEHPVTEEITGLDLVEWQLRVAAGERLPLLQGEISAHGHAVEARLYAEDPDENFLPQAGRFRRLEIGAGDSYVPGEDVRVDTGFRSGDEFTPFYDPMIAKVIAHADDRQAALGRCADALVLADIEGVATNRDFLVKILRHPVFRESPPSTNFLSATDIGKSGEELEDIHLVAAALSLAGGGVPDADRLGFRLNAPRVVMVTFERAKEPVVVQVEADGMALSVRIGDRQMRGALDVVDPLVNYRLRLGEEVFSFSPVLGVDEGAVILSTDDGFLRVPLFDPMTRAGAADAAVAALSAPMPSTVTGVLVKVGDRVAAGQPLVTLEAMKMETVIKAPADGTVLALHATAGASAPKGRQLVELSDS